MATNSVINNYTLGKGEVYLSTFKTGTQKPAGFRYIGNTPELSVKISSKTLDHYSSEAGIREKDQQVITDIDRAGGLTTDNLSIENIAIFFLGESVKTAIGSAVNVTGEALTSVKAGTSYLLGTATWVMGARGIDAASVVVKKGSTTFAPETDYVVDGDRGMIDLVAGGAIVDGDDLTIDYTVKVTSYEGIVSGTTPFEGALFFKATNAVGERIDYLLPWVKISPDGDYNLKSESWTEMKFSLEVLKPTGREAFYGNGQPMYA